MSGLASPWRSWGDSARRWVEAHRSGEPEQRQAVINTVFGELYKLRGEAPPLTQVQALRGGYNTDEVPADARGITCGVDVQRDKLYFAVRAWGPRSTSWLIRAGELYGETDQQAVWNDLATIMDAAWGGRMRIRMMMVDSGFRPDMVYAFARRYPGRCYPSKGHDGQPRPVSITKIDLANKDGKSARRGTALAHVDASYFKGWVHGRIVWPIGEPGAWHLPTDASDDFCAQITAESQIVKPNGRVIWVRDGKKANHYLDCEGLNAACAHVLNVHLLKPKQEEADTAPSQGEEHALVEPRRRPNWVFEGRTRGRNWTTNWK